MGISVRDGVKGHGKPTWLRPVVTTSNMRATWPELPSRGVEETELLLTTGCWNKCRNQIPGVVGRVMEHEDNRVLNRLGKRVEVLLKHDMTMVGLDGLISSDEEKKVCACCGNDSCRLESIDAMSKGNWKSVMGWGRARPMTTFGGL